jgi:methylmalonyl-CoA mutase N-terminal domain/subunit
MAAVLGGTQSLHTNSLDETYCLPTEEAVTIALRTQQILAHETGAADVIDPLAGSYFVEALTDEVEEAARDYIRKIDDMGGIVEAIERGYPQMEIAESAYRFQREVESKERIIVGINDFVEEAEPPIEMLRIDPIVEAGQKQKMADFKKGRDQDKARRAIDAIRAGCRSGENLMPLIVEGVKDRVTLGEISDLFREEFGVYTDPAFC